MLVLPADVTPLILLLDTAFSAFALLLSLSRRTSAFQFQFRSSEFHSASRLSRDNPAESTMMPSLQKMQLLVSREVSEAANVDSSNVP